MNILDKIFDEKYYKIKHFEQDGKIYEYLGIKRFRKALLHIAKDRKDEVPFKNYFLTEYSVNAIKKYEQMSRKSEKSHVIIATVMLLYTVRIGVFIKDIFDIMFLLFFTLVNIITNIYPIFLQRYNRIRIQKILNKIEV